MSWSLFCCLIYRQVLKDLQFCSNNPSACVIVSLSHATYCLMQILLHKCRVILISATYSEDALSILNAFGCHHMSDIVLRWLLFLQTAIIVTTNKDQMLVSAADHCYPNWRRCHRKSFLLFLPHRRGGL